MKHDRSALAAEGALNLVETEAMPGIRRVRRADGFRYAQPDGSFVTDDETLERIRALAIPPAWQHVWICPDPQGHIQATGWDKAQRKQYRYHSQWRLERDREKHDLTLLFAAELPRVRRRLKRDLARELPDRRRVLACALRLLDLGAFRAGGEERVDDDSGFGLATLERWHVELEEPRTLLFDFVGKSGKHQQARVSDQLCFDVIQDIYVHDPDGLRVLSYLEGDHWVDIRRSEISSYLKRISGNQLFSPKMFRTWNATLLAAVLFASKEPAPASERSLARVKNDVFRSVASQLGNTPAVTRASYVDPRVVSLYEEGVTIRAALDELKPRWPLPDKHREHLEQATLDMLRGDAPDLAETLAGRARDAAALALR